MKSSLLLVAIAASASVPMTLGAAGPKFAPIPPKVVAAYARVGAAYGKYVPTESQGLEFVANPLPTDGLPGFLIAASPDGTLPRLPKVPVPFGLDFSRSGMTDAGLEGLKDLEHLTCLDLSGSSVTDAGLQEVARLGNLTHLDLSRTNVSAAGWKELKRLRKLTYLDLEGTTATEAGVRELKDLGLSYLGIERAEMTDALMEALREAKLLHVSSVAQAAGGGRPATPAGVAFLDLRYTRVTDAGLKELKDFANLTHLDLSHTGVSAGCPKELKRLAKLAYLDLDGLELTEEGIGCLKGLAGLSEVYLSTPQVTDAVLKALRDNGLLHLVSIAWGPNGRRPTSPADVASLDLRYSRVTDAGLKALKGLPRLTTLYLAGPSVTDAALKALRDSGLLHVASIAEGKDGERPATAGDVVSLDLSHTALTDAGLGELKGLTGLAALDLSDTRVTDAGLKELKVFPALASLALDRTPVTGEGLRGLKGVKNLTALRLADSQVTDSVLKALCESDLLHTSSLACGTEDGRPTKASEIVSLGLGSTSVTDAGLAELKHCVNLTSLFPPVAVTAAGLKQLAPLRMLTKLYLDGDRLTDAALGALREADLLHALTIAEGPDGKRPASAAGVVSLDLSRSRVTDAGLGELRVLVNLSRLALEPSRVTDETLKVLRTMGRLHVASLATARDGGRPAKPADVASVDLGRTQVTDAGLKELEAFSDLASLRLGARGLEGGIKGLAAFRKLADLDLADVRVTDESLRALRKLDLLHATRLAKGRDGKRAKSFVEIVSLDLSGTAVTEAGLKELAGMKKLTTLTLRPSQVTDGALKALREAQLLKALSATYGPFGIRPWSPARVFGLDLSTTPITDAGLKELNDFVNLLTLELRSTAITDAGLKTLEGFEELVDLDLTGTKVTDAGVERFRAALPKCRVVR